MRVALTGGGGFVGGFVKDALLRAGHELHILSRPDYQLGDSPNLTGCDALLHCAFDHIAGRYRGGEGDDPDSFVARNLDGTCRLFEAAKTQGVGQVVFLSTRAVYGDYPLGTPLSEDMQPRPDTLYGSVKWQAEQVLDGLSGQGFRGASLRATGVYGHGPKHKWQGLFAAFLAQKPIAPRRSTEVSGADLGVAVCLLLNSQAQGPFNLSDILLDRRDLLARFAALCGVSYALPERSETPVSVMACDRLHALGWRPSGPAALDETLRQIVAEQDCAPLF